MAINASSSLMKNTTIQSKRFVIGGLEIIGLNFEPSHDWVELLGMSHDDNCLAVTGYVGHVLGYLPPRNKFWREVMRLMALKNILNSMVTGHMPVRPQ